MQISIYSTPTCPYCHQAKDYFKSKNIAFEDFNVADDKDKADEMVKLSGQMGVPVIKIGDKVIIGFDQSQIEKELK